MWNRSLAPPDFLGQKTTPIQGSLAESTYVWHEAKLSLGGEEACVCNLRVPRTRGSPLQSFQGCLGTGLAVSSPAFYTLLRESVPKSWSS